MSSELGKRQNKRISDKAEMYELLDASFEGGQVYRDKQYLTQYYRESTDQYENRLDRSTYINHLQEILKVLIGLLYNKRPDRLNTPKELDYLKTNIDKINNIDVFMHRLACKSMIYTTGLLIDSPDTQVESMKERRDKNINPYCIVYHPSKIKDFYFNDSGNLSWVLLDDTVIEKSDPMTEDNVLKYLTLWTENEYFKYINIDKELVLVETFTHNLNRCPFLFVNSGDNVIETTIFEDIVELSKKIYETLSYMDESLASGSFNSLFYPVDTLKDMEKVLELSHDNISELTVIPYPASGGGKPFFDGVKLDNVEMYIKAVILYTKQLLHSVGLDYSEEKVAPESGKAKELDFKNTESLLIETATYLENIENEIFIIAGLWEGKQYTNKDIGIIYNKDFISSDEEQRLTRLYEYFSFTDDEKEKEDIREKIKEYVLKG